MDEVNRFRIEEATELLLAVLEDLKSREEVVPELPTQPAPTTSICWGNRVSKEFRDSVLWIQGQLGLKADYLMTCMYFETGGTFSPKAANPVSSATGLIQFMDATVASMVKQYPVLAKSGIRKAEDLEKLSAVQQLAWVFYYFKAFGNDLSKWSLEDTYMAILLPAMIGKPLTERMKWSQSAYHANRGLDWNKDGTITKEEATRKIRELYKLGMENMA